MKPVLLRLLILIAACAILFAFAVIVVAPQLNWTAAARPSSFEARLAGYVLRRSIARKAGPQRNPFPATAENIKAGEHEYMEHCAVCHAPDGSAHDQLGAHFYPPIARLTRGLPHWTDAELYYVIANGIRYTGMPAFGPHHDPDEIWKMILWLRHLPDLTPQEKAELNQHREGFMEHHEDSGAQD